MEVDFFVARIPNKVNEDNDRENKVPRCCVTPSKRSTAVDMIMGLVGTPHPGLGRRGACRGSVGNNDIMNETTKEVEGRELH